MDILLLLRGRHIKHFRLIDTAYDSKYINMTEADIYEVGDGKMLPDPWRTEKLTDTNWLRSWLSSSSYFCTRHLALDLWI
jgi:hypothetical protein